MKSAKQALSAIDPQRASGILLLVVGIIGIGLIIYFQKEVDLPVKIALALAAAGVAGALPRNLIFKNKMVSAGGAIGVFCLVMFYDIGQTWIQPISKPGQQLSPVTMSKKQMVFQNGLMSAQFEMVSGQYGTAIDLIRQMLKLREDDRLALRMLGFAYFKKKNFHESARAYERAFDADSTRTDANSAYSAALMHDAGGDNKRLSSGSIQPIRS